MYSERFLSDTSSYAFSRNALISLLGMLLLPLVLAGCSDSPVGSGGDRVEDPQKRPNTFQVEGTVAQQQVNGEKAWIIESAGGQTYLPVNFRTGTLKTGLRVRAEVEPLKPQRIEDRRDEIGRDLPEEEIIDANSGRLVKIKSIEVLGGTDGEARTNQIIWEGHFFNGG